MGKSSLEAGAAAIAPIPVRIPIRPINQEDRADCLLVCLRMVLDYFGLAIDSQTVDAFFIKQGTTFSLAPEVTDCALFARRAGLSVDCLAYNLYLTDPRSDALLSSQALLEKLRAKQVSLSQAQFAPALESIIRCLEAGCTYRIARPKLQTIGKYLKRQIPLIAIVNRPALTGRAGEDLFVAHAIALTGAWENDIFFIDPQLGREERISGEDLLFAMLQSKIIANSAYILALSGANSLGETASEARGGQ